MVNSALPETSTAQLSGSQLVFPGMPYGWGALKESTDKGYRGSPNLFLLHIVNQNVNYSFEAH